MMEKLVLNIQFECHKAGIQLPWDKIVHRLNPGSSGPAATQMLNKMRDILICEGHLIPPAMGKRTMKVDPMVRGYVRDLTKQDPRAARILYWTEPYENAKYSLDWGTTLGSGQYRKLLKNPKVEEDSDDVEKPRLFQLPSSNANPRQRIPTGGGDIRRAKPTPRKSRAKIVSSDEEDEDEIEIKPEELDPDDDWSPEAGKMKKTKGGRRKVAVRTRITRLTESESEGESVHHSSSSGSPTPSYIVKLPIRVPESVGNTNRRQRAVARNTLGSEDEKDDAMNDHAMKMEEDAEHEVDSDGNEDFESGAGGDREMDSTTMSSGNNSQAYSGVYSSQAPMYRVCISRIACLCGTKR
ncbi:uncharacterized protein LY89DRAFT_318840 [Mollisia scopiformis]|uniref:Uncharacterized protein n=1 Tax=Mollisia scopiformis TaxID=149040 RepID=A0A132B9J2_MOLSC|nr:uncharacterized protein LY89DRAFT_318840 [Mollisia scopiformis]KUJ09065.1 hypothetical protein LY89DRAFT_318840 [Mollisia scopiformis]